MLNSLLPVLLGLLDTSREVELLEMAFLTFLGMLGGDYTNNNHNSNHNSNNNNNEMKDL